MIQLPIYNYTAKDLSGKTVRGTLKSENTSALRTSLAEKQLFLLRSEEVSNASGRRKLSSKELAIFSREIGTMLSAGVTLVRALGIVINRENPVKLKKIYNDLNQALKSGVSFSEALRAQGVVFPEIFINMIYAGEASGQLDKTVLKMAVYYEKESRLNGRIKNAMMYPKILLAVTFIVVLIIFTFVLPSFFDMFKGMTLPLPTRIVIAISNFFVKDWYIALALALIIIGLVIVLRRNERYILFINKIKLRIPKIKVLLRIIYTARFARTLCALYSSGLPLVNSVQIGQSTIGNRYISAQFDEVISQVKSGVPLSKAVSSIDGFDSKLSSVIMIGEETGHLTDMLTAVADSFDYESENATTRLVTLIEPAMIVSMALVIGSIMISVLLPILNIYSNINGA